MAIKRKIFYHDLEHNKDLKGTETYEFFEKLSKKHSKEGKDLGEREAKPVQGPSERNKANRKKAGKTE